MKLFQYWDTPDPPAEVAEWIEGFKVGNPGFRHQLYDREAASWFIRKQVGEREQRAFDAIVVPSMQSDYFRYCAIWAKGGVYVDADFQSIAPLGGLLDQAPRSMMLVWDHHLVAGLLMARASGDPLVRACLDLTTANIEARWGRNAYIAAGPGVINAVRWLIDPASRPLVERGFDNVLARNWRFEDLVARARDVVPVTAELTQALAELTAVHVLDTAAWIGTDQPRYKETSTHWLHWRGPIYSDQAVDVRP